MDGTVQSQRTPAMFNLAPGMYHIKVARSGAFSNSTCSSATASSSPSASNSSVAVQGVGKKKTAGRNDPPHRVRSHRLEAFLCNIPRRELSSRCYALAKKQKRAKTRGETRLRPGTGAGPLSSLEVLCLQQRKNVLRSCCWLATSRTESIAASLSAHSPYRGAESVLEFRAAIS